jgi:hypothetical protein
MGLAHANSAMIKPNRQSNLLMTRRLLSLAVAVAFTLTLLPIPLPVAAPVRTPKDTSSPFPCQNRPCGCSSADQCWKKCCCFTNQQKVAWAKKYDVSIPQFVAHAAKDEANSESQMNLAELSDEQLETEICSLPDRVEIQHPPTEEHEDSPSTTPRTAARGLLGWTAGLLDLPQKHRPDKLIARLGAQVTHVTVQLRESFNTKFDEHSESKSVSVSVSDIRLVMIIKALECRGQGGQWIVCAPVAMPVSVCVAGQSETPAEFVKLVSERLSGGSRQPPVPPPRIGQAGRTLALSGRVRRIACEAAIICADSRVCR